VQVFNAIKTGHSHGSQIVSQNIEGMTLPNLWLRCIAWKSSGQELLSHVTPLEGLCIDRSHFLIHAHLLGALVSVISGGSI